MPQKLLAANVIICDRILDEKDNVFSAIRIVDLFTVPIHPAVPLEEQGIQVNSLVHLKSQIDDNEEHHVRLDLVRPNGEVTPLFESSVAITTMMPGTPGGANFVFRIGVIPKQMGTHYITLTVDGNEINRGAFTLREPEASKG